MAVTSLNSFLEYRPWRGLRNPVWMGAFAITRESLKLIFTRKVFWVVFSLAVLNFLLYFLASIFFLGCGSAARWIGACWWFWACQSKRYDAISTQRFKNGWLSRNLP